MVLPVFAPTSVAPSLAWGLQKIARTPRARLQVGYHLVPRGPCPASGWLPGSECHDVLHAAPDRLRAGWWWDGLPARLHLPLPLGRVWLIQRLVAGGIVGERLPLANLRCEAAERLACGQLIDLVA